MTSSDVSVTTEQVGEYVDSLQDTSAVNFTLGQPSPSTLAGIQPKLGAAAAKALGSDTVDPTLLQYGKALGYDSFRKDLLQFLQERGQAELSLDNIMVTAGNSHTLHMLSSAFLMKGDVVIVEAPTYFLASQIFNDAGCRVYVVPVDKDGLVVSELESLMKAEEITPRAVYTIPNFHNPTGVTMSAERREQLLALARKHKFYIFSDEPYTLLNFEADTSTSTTPVKSLIESDDVSDPRVLAMGTFSKILAPGLRLGWLLAHSALMDRVANLGFIWSGGGLNPVVSAMVHEFIRAGDLGELIPSLNTQFSSKCNCLVKAIESHLPDFSVIHQPSGGYFLWVQLPSTPQARAEPFRDFAAKHHDVTFLPGSSCLPRELPEVQEGVRDDLSKYIRLSFAFYTEPELELGVRRIAHAWEAYTASL